MAGFFDRAGSFLGEIGEGAERAQEVAREVGQVAETVEDVTEGEQDVIVGGGPDPTVRTVPTRDPTSPVRGQAQEAGLSNTTLLLLFGAALLLIANQ